jgi:phosphatidylethanolamine-binding protein (PEBP) family uncharacterized protein
MHEARLGIRRKIIVAGATAAGFALAACGAAGSTSRSSTANATTTTQSATSAATDTASTAGAEHVPTADITLRSSIRLNPVPDAYTCAGANRSLPVSWNKVPAGTAEIDLFIVHTEPTNRRLVTDWGVAGLKPNLRTISAGRLPSGAIVGRNGSSQARYSVCPPKGHTLEYVLVLLALPHRIPAKAGFDARTLRAKTLAIATSEGLLDFESKRR